jgi:hypothetical protein
MHADYVPSSWDEVGFRDFCEIIDEACDPQVAPFLVASYRNAAHAYEHPGTLSGKSIPVEETVLRTAARQLRRFSGTESAALSSRLQDLDGSYLLAAISALGAFPQIGDSQMITVPGRYDREIEWLSKLPLRSSGRIPLWEDVLDALRTARRCILGDFVDPSPDDTPLMQLRKKSVMAGDLGVTFVPIARELTQRLSHHSIETISPLQDSHLMRFADETERLFDRHVHLISEIVRRTLPFLRGAVTQSEVLERVTQAWEVGDLVSALEIDESLAQLEGIRDLTSQISKHKEQPMDLRARPLLAVGDAAVLVLPRRIACDRHEVLDLAVSRFLRRGGLPAGEYPQLRASMLDDVIAESLRNILPGCRRLIGQTWSLGGTEYERDVVVLYEDIAVCVETKAPQMVPSVRSSHRDVVEVLKSHISYGVKQVTSIADALEAGTAVIDGITLPKVRRAYRLVASFNSWWGIDLAASALLDEGVFPTLDSAMLTSADKFVSYETLFEAPADFIAYLEHRLSHQRRPWVTVADEFEMIGGYFSNPRDSWRQRPPKNVSYMIKDTFQEDVNQTMYAAYMGDRRRSTSLQRKHHPVIADNLTAWEAERPTGWLQAFSAVSRLDQDTQVQVAEALAQRSSWGSREIRTVQLPERSCTLVIFGPTERITPLIWDNIVRNAPVSVPIVAIQREGNVIRAVRGIDDAECWIDPRFSRYFNRPPASDSKSLATAKPPRVQPKRKRRRA